MRDENSETPANSNDLFNMWSLESITCITLDQRLGLFNPNSKDENGKKLVKVSEVSFCVGVIKILIRICPILAFCS